MVYHTSIAKKSKLTHKTIATMSSNADIKKRDNDIKKQLAWLNQNQSRFTSQQFFDKKHALRMRLSVIPESARAHEAMRVPCNGTLYYIDVKDKNRLYRTCPNGRSYLDDEQREQREQDKQREQRQQRQQDKQDQDSQQRQQDIQKINKAIGELRKQQEARQISSQACFDEKHKLHMELFTKYGKELPRAHQLHEAAKVEKGLVFYTDMRDKTQSQYYLDQTGNRVYFSEDGDLIK